MENSKYYGGRDIYGRLLKTDLAANIPGAENTLIINDIESEYNALIEALDGEVVTP